MKKLIALLLITPALASADPGAAARYLINEPASLMDLGIFSLNSRLQNMQDNFLSVPIKSGSAKDFSEYELFAYYDHSKDEFRIHVQAITSGDAPVEACVEIINWLRRIMGRQVKNSFYHAVDDRASRPHALLDDILERTNLYCDIFPKRERGKALYQILSVNGSFDGTEVHVETNVSNQEK